MNIKPIILHIAVPTPLRRCFDYLPPANVPKEQLQAGQRLLVPFGKRQVVGLLLSLSDNSDFPIERIKPALELIDKSPILSPNLLSLGHWASHYYHHPIGDVFSQMLPALLRKGKTASFKADFHWQLTEKGHVITAESLKRAPKQAQALEILKQFPEGLSEPAIKLMNLSLAPLKALREKGFIERLSIASERSFISENPSPTLSANGTATEHSETRNFLKEVPLPLNDEQSTCYLAIASDIDQITNATTKKLETEDDLKNKAKSLNYLIEGVTGSGKTEVYLQLINKCLDADLQSLILVPEIGLTPQIISRFEHRFNATIVTLHSGLSDRKRLDNWLKAQSGAAQIIIGTRSAAFIPMVKPGLIIVDEEHDTSFTQQDGFRYSARDIAIIRGNMGNYPVVLGSASPCLESMQNALSGKYTHLKLTHRATKATLPTFVPLDISKQKLSGGLCQLSLQAISKHLQASNQVLVFLNRRGFAPQLICHPCGWQAKCRHCDCALTLHKSKFQTQGSLHCHHCGWHFPAPAKCPECDNKKLIPLGTGTEQLEDVLGKHFRHHDIVRIDRDSTRTKDAFEQKLEKIHTGKAMILVGTQMLAKGHHFPDVTLVVLVDIDSSLFSTDFRAAERIAQLVTQVAGRAGRAEKPGTVILQTQQPDHPLLLTLMTQGYHKLALQELHQRQQACWPPFSHLALLRAESPHMEQSLAFLEESAEAARNILQNTSFSPQSVELMGPVPAPMEKRVGRFRAQLLLQCSQRKPLHQFLDQWIPFLEASKAGKRVRWSLDVDPSEIY